MSRFIRGAGTTGTLAVLAAALLATPAGAAARRCPHPPTLDPRVPTWGSVNHFALGSRPATDEEIGAYVLALGRSSPRVRSGALGRSWQGRPLPYALVSSPAALSPRRLRRLSTQLRAVRAGTATGHQRARVRRGPAVVWIGASVHGNEPSGGDADMRLLYELAARTDCANLARLQRLVVVIAPVQNPDGRAAGTRVNAYGFDLNRDWFADTQPETRARLALMDRLPPVALGDQHEQPGEGFFFPPNSDPIHHEVPAESLTAINSVFAPALAAAFDARSLEHASYGPYDLFYMGLGDVASSTLFGAAGMTFEQGAQAPWPQRVAQQLLAAQTLVDSAAARRRALLAGWVALWTRAAAQGGRGELAPNRVLVAGDQVTRPVPSQRVYAYLLGGDRGRADVEQEARALSAAGVRVYRLTRSIQIVRLHRYGTPGLTAGTAAAGSLVVPLQQASKHWAQAMLGEDAYTPFAYFYDVSAWSAPLLSGLDGGYTSSPLPSSVWRAGRPGRLLVPWTSPAPRRLQASPSFALATDAERSLELAFALAGRGVALRRVPGVGSPGTAEGSVIVGGDIDRALLGRLARQHDTELRPVDRVPAGAVSLRVPRVAMLDAPDTPGAGSDQRPTGALSHSWWRFVLEQRLGLRVTMLTADDLAGGRLGGGAFTHLLVAEGTSAPSLSLPALAAVQAFVRGGGIYVGERSQGVAIAQAAGVTTAQIRPAPPGLIVAGALIGVSVNRAGPLTWGVPGPLYAFNTGDPLLSAGVGATVVAAYPDAGPLFISGYVEGADALRGTAALTDEAFGAGHTVLFSFDPAFRAYTTATERLLANALLYPAGSPVPTGSSARHARLLRKLDPSRLTQSANRPAIVRVARRDRDRLALRARGAGLPPGWRLRDDPGSSTLLVPTTAGDETQASPWVGRLLGGLTRDGVRPTLLVL